MKGANNEKCLLPALVGLAIGFALPTFAQQANTPDPKLSEAFTTLCKKFDDAYIKGDAAALAALYTEDATLLRSDGAPIYGRDAIEQYWRARFQQGHYNTQNLCRSALHLPRREADRRPHPQLRPAPGFRRSRARQGTARSAPGSTRHGKRAGLARKFTDQMRRNEIAMLPEHTEFGCRWFGVLYDHLLWDACENNLPPP